jgi:hypothetical protein
VPGHEPSPRKPAMAAHFFPDWCSKSGFTWGCLLGGGVALSRAVDLRLQCGDSFGICVGLLYALGDCRYFVLGWLQLKSGSLWTAPILKP